MIQVAAAATAAEVWFGIALFAFAMFATAVLSACAIRYARRRDMLDHPGPRRSHALPTPRGGGVAPVLVLLGGGIALVAGDSLSRSDLGVCLIALAIIAAIGWLDDHRPLSAALRLPVHMLAGLIASLALMGSPQTPAQIVVTSGCAVLIAGFVNAWNFMDGINGLATSQAGLVVAALLIGGGAAGAWLDGSWRGFGWLLIAAMLGFLPFNFPRARIFLGDVGSGALGFVVSCLLVRAVVAGGLSWRLAWLPASAFLLDAGLTLLWRIARGKRWWRPHREHLYQWLVRSGCSHVSVTGWYALWTIVAGALMLIAAGGGAVGVWISVGALLFGCLFWMWLRSRLWKTARLRIRPHR